MQPRDGTLITRARVMRHDPTPAEGELWRALRGAQVDGFRFRRQHPVGRYIADFACVSARLIVECDGDTHVGQAYDAEREAWLRAQGWRVLRVSNLDVRQSLDGVVETIRRALTSPTPSRPAAGPLPLPQAGEGM